MIASSSVRTFDVVVVGAGPAGMAAAVEAARAGRQVAVIDDNVSAGGQIWRGDRKVGDQRARLWFGQFQRSGAAQFIRCQVIAGRAASRTLLVESSEEALQLQWGTLILATGAKELFLPFPGWTLPGVAGVGGLQALVKSGLPIAGKRVAIGGTGPLLLASAAYLKRHGARIVLLVEQAPSRKIARFASELLRFPSKVVEAVRLSASLFPLRHGSGTWIEAAQGAGRVERVLVSNGRRRFNINCEFVATGYGLVPNIELASLLGCEIRDGAVWVDDLQRTSVDGIYCAGEATGVGGLDLALSEGRIAGLVASGQVGRAREHFSERARAQSFARLLNETFALRPELKQLPAADTIVCRCEDVRLAQLTNMSCWREAKLHTRCGMGPCQGRVCGPALEYLKGWRNESVRPPLFPAAVSSLIETADSHEVTGNL